MSKVICDVCGTAFPETATQCPICGSAKASSAQTAAGSSQRDGENTTSYAYVKGGRFSKSNVRKRNTRGAAPQRRPSQERQPQRKQSGQEEPANIALIAVVILLLLAIVAVVIYIAVRVIGPTTVPSTDTKPNQTQSTQQTTSVGTDISCTSLTILPVVTLENVGDTWLISVTKQEPADTTDKIIWSSADPSIATVSDTGLVTAVANGQTTITATCGSIKAECKVICGSGSTEEPPVDDKPDFELKLNREDFSLSKYGEKWNLYSGSVSAEEITWISDDPTICTIEKGVVTAVGPGDTKVHAQYGDQKVTCIVRCRDTVVAAPTDPQVSISKTDVSITVGETFSLLLTKKGAEGESDQLLNVTWTSSEEGIVTINGNKITGAAESAKTGIKVSATYEGNTYECIVRVKAKTTE